jgi:hypothetical protein
LIYSYRFVRLTFSSAETEHIYQEYRTEYMTMQKQAFFFKAHKDEDWLKDKYDPSHLETVHITDDNADYSHPQRMDEQKSEEQEDKGNSLIAQRDNQLHRWQSYPRL